MSEHLSAEIWIGGNIPETLSPISAPPSPTRASPSNGARLLRAEDRQDLNTSLRENDQHERLLWLCDDQASWGQFENLERFLREHRIPFTVAQKEMTSMTRRLSNTGPCTARLHWLPTLLANRPSWRRNWSPSSTCWTRRSSWPRQTPGQTLLSLMQTALKLLREQLPRPLPPLEPFSIEPTCGSKGGEHDDEEETEEDEEDKAVAGG